jgi:hypothetical protein
MSPLTESTRLTLAKSFTWNESVWNPSMISTALWLDAADSTTINATSGAVTEWRTKTSGSSIAFTPANSDSTRRPATGASTQNSKNVIDFDGSNDALSAGDVLDSIWTTGQYEIFYLAKSNSVASAGTLIAKSSAVFGNTFQFEAILKAKSSLVAFEASSATVYTQVGTSADTASNGTYLIAAKGYNVARAANGTTANNTARYSIFINGSLQSLAVQLSNGNLSSSYPDTTSHLSLGGIIGTGAGNAASLNGSIAELIVLPTISSTDTRQRIEGYLAWKWGLTANLPAGHPYKTIGPTP